MRYGLTTRDFWNTAREFSPWFQEIDDMMDRLLVPVETIKRENKTTFNVACDVEETGSHYLMSFDLPGISKEDVKIEVVDNKLTVSGERKSEKKDDKNNHYVTERHYGSFQRSFTLPSTIDASHVEASYKDGVLQIALPKAESAKPRQIKISEGGSRNEREVTSKES
jgi:HSP20 family protein